MQKKHSFIGLTFSIGLHLLLAAATLFAFTHSEKPPVVEQHTHISMEMLAARLEQPEVAVVPEPAPQPQNVPEPEKPVEPTPEPIAPKVAEPKIKPQEKPKPPEKPIEKPKEKQKPKESEKNNAKPQAKIDKTKPKDKPTPPKTKINALEKGEMPKQGVAEKAQPQAVKAEKSQPGTTQGATNANLAKGNNNAGELDAYKAQLQRTLQRQAMNSYPQREKSLRKTGVVTLSFTINAAGQLVNVQVVASSGNSNLDNAALKVAQSIKMPPPPTQSNWTVPIRYAIN